MTLHAPEGKLISAYCVKAGSDKQGLGPKIVVLDEPVAEVTIAYADVVKRRCKDISHYSVAYVDAPKSPEDESTPPSDEESTPPSDDESTPPSGGESTPPSDDQSTPPSDDESTSPSDDESTPPAAEETPGTPFTNGDTPGDEASTAVPTTGASPSSAPAAVVSGDDTTPSAGPNDGRLAATDEVSVVKTTGRLAFTGAQVAGVLVAAVVLVAIGTLAIHASRRRADSRA